VAHRNQLGRRVFGLQAITLIAFRRFGPVEGGRVGLSLTIMGAASAGALTWVSTKSASFGRLAAQRNYDELEALYRFSIQRARLAVILATSLLVLLTLVLRHQWPRFAERMVPAYVMALLAVATISNVQVSAQAIFLRAFRREPFMTISVVSGGCICLACVVASHWFGTPAIIGAYSTISLCIALFWCRPLFARYASEFKH